MVTLTSAENALKSVYLNVLSDYYINIVCARWRTLFASSQKPDADFTQKKYTAKILQQNLKSVKTLLRFCYTCRVRTKKPSQRAARAFSIIELFIYELSFH